MHFKNTLYIYLKIKISCKFVGGEGGERDKEIRTVKEVRKCINGERRRKESVSEEITTQEWVYLMGLLEGREKKGTNRNEEEADSARRNRNLCRRGGAN
jgi:hypothetical protein